MISDNTFTLEDFHKKVRDFAQSFADKINDVNVTIELSQEGPADYLLRAIKKGRGVESYSIRLNSSGKVETISVYEV